MRLVTLAEIRPVLEDKASIIEAVKAGFIAHSQGQINLPAPIHMLFSETDEIISGDCHVKTATSSAYPYFCIKVATGFYNNPQNGLAVNNGLVMLLSSETGHPIALFQDEGHLTSARTAAAGALAAGLAFDDIKPRPKRLGIIGTGHQAELQARWILDTHPISSLVIWGRNPQKAEALAKRLTGICSHIKTASTPARLCQEADIIVTTTPSTSPLLMAADIRADHHIIALGSDSPGKTELDPLILANADSVVVDDLAQCRHHGECAHALKAGVIQKDLAVTLGHVLDIPSKHRITQPQLCVVDLTGLGAQDLAIASWVYQRLEAKI